MRHAYRFDEKPDYAYLRRLFRNLFAKEGWNWDFVFDWTILKHQRTMHAAGASPAPERALGPAETTAGGQMGRGWRSLGRGLLGSADTTTGGR